MSRADHDPAPGAPLPCDVRALVRRYAAVEEWNRDPFGDYEGVYRSAGTDGYRGRRVCVEVADARISSVHQSGRVGFEGAWCDDALAAVFAWGAGKAVAGRRQPAPELLVLGPGAPLDAGASGTSHMLRVGLRGRALAAAMADPRLDGGRRRWLRPELVRPRLSPAVEWHLQNRILATARFTERALARAAMPEDALRVAAAEVVAALVATLAAADPEPEARDASQPVRTRLVAAALERMEGTPDEPVSIATVCRELATSERTLQRAFDEILGVGPRAYERERRLRRVHGTILAEGHHRTVTDIAMSFGFWHLGRFAGAYAALFGCSPSETRRRAWSEPPAPAAVGAPS